jgi:hypothetical protein
MSRIFYHLSPPYIGETYMAFFPSEKDYEQLWLSKISDDRYRIECIPFFLYGFNYHDIVSLEELNGDLLFKDLVEASNWFSFRVKVEDSTPFIRILKDTAELGAIFEKSSVSMYAFSVEGSDNANHLFAYFSSLQDLGYIVFETSDK